MLLNPVPERGIQRGNGVENSWLFFYHYLLTSCQLEGDGRFHHGDAPFFFAYFHQGGVAFGRRFLIEL